MLHSTFMILTLLQQTTIMIIFYSIMLDLTLKRQKHAKFLNSLVDLDSNLAKFNTISTEHCDKDLLSLHKQNILVVCVYATVCILHSISNRHVMQPVEHLWNALQFFQTTSIMLTGYYIRCFAIILHCRCTPVFKTLDSIRNHLRYTNNNNNERIPDLIECFEAFDDVMNLKNQLSSIYGIQLLLNSAFDFIILTISVYGLLYFDTKSITVLYYFIAFNLPHAIKCVLLVLALDTLANQVIPRITLLSIENYDIFIDFYR